MKSKRFEYYVKDIKYLKKDIVIRTIFTVLFLAIFIWQMIALVGVEKSSNASLMQFIVSGIVLLSSLMLSLVSLAYVFKDFRIISVIKTNGKCISSVMILFKTQKHSFIWLYKLLIQVLTLITTLVFIASVTYSILEISYLSSISFYMPTLILVCFAGFNSIYHIKDEIYIQDILHEQQPLY